jgi:predicted TIM-barrel fold metal-dependent hydrolase
MNTTLSNNEASLPIIDCDIHQPELTREQWVAYLPEPYKSEVARYGTRSIRSGIRTEDGGLRRDLLGEIDGLRLRDPEFYSRNLFDRYNIRYGILSGGAGPTAGIPDPDYTAAIAQAMNNYYLENWLPRDERFLLTIHITQADPALAVREIERLAGTPRVVAVSFHATANRIPFGNRYYWPIYEACEKHGLPLHIHPSTTATIANAAMTPAGQCPTYLESHVCMPQFYMAQVASFVFGGVFEKFPGLRVMLVEGGISWLPHLLWRMDAEFKGLRHQAPFLKRMPSEYVLEQVRLASQPVEEPQKPEHLLQIFEMMDAHNLLMYASDFPHWDFDEPAKLPRALKPETRRRILHDNACELLKLPAYQPQEPQAV